MTCDFMSFSTVFQSYAGQWAGDNERLCPPQAGLEPATACSVGQRLTYRTELPGLLNEVNSECTELKGAREIF